MVMVTHGPSNMNGGRRQRSSRANGNGSGGGGGGGGDGSGSSGENGSPLVAARGKIIAKKRRSRARALARLKKAGSRAQKAARALARAARRRKDAVRAWHREERRREHERANIVPANKQPATFGGKPPSGPTDKSIPGDRRVSFADTLLVTSIPVDFEEVLPQPVQSPLHAAAKSNDEKAVVVGDIDDDDTDDDDPDFDPRAIAFAHRWARLRPANNANVLEQDAASDTSDDSGSMEVSEGSDDDGNESVDSDDSECSTSSSGSEPSTDIDLGKKQKERRNGRDAGKAGKGSNSACAAPSGQDESVPDSPVNHVVSDCQQKDVERNDSKDQLDTTAPPAKRPRPFLAKTKRVVDKHVKAHAANSTSLTDQDTPSKMLSNGLAAEEGQNPLVGTAAGGSAAPKPDVGEEIDSMFAGKRKKLKPSTVASPNDDIKLNNQRGGKTGPIKPRSAPRYTEDGLRILTYDDIKAENTQELTGECPFDCSCCY